MIRDLEDDEIVGVDVVVRCGFDGWIHDGI